MSIRMLTQFKICGARRALIGWACTSLFVASLIVFGTVSASAAQKEQTENNSAQLAPTAAELNAEALEHYSQGRYIEAEPLYLRALEAFERTLGRAHPFTLTLVNNLAELYSAQGRYTEAEPLYLRALDARERTLGAEHPDTLTSVNNLANLYANQGRYTEAEPLYLRALEASERTLGPDHLLTLTSVNNLAVLYDFQGRYAEAEPLYLRALEAGERTLGAEHPATLGSATNLARLYNAQGRYTEAEPLYLRALEAWERTLGTEHPSTLTSINNLAVLYYHQGRYTEAEPLYLRALEARERTLGREHPSSMGSAQSLTQVRLRTNLADDDALSPARLLVDGMRARRAQNSGNLFGDQQREREMRSSGLAFTYLADAAWQSDDRDQPALRAESFTALQDAIAGPANQAIARMAVRRFADEASEGLGALVRERESLSDQWRVLNNAIGSSFGGSTADDAHFRQELTEDLSAIVLRMDAIDARLRDEFPDYFALIRPEALDTATAQALLAEDEAILLTVPSDFGTHVMAVTRNAIEWHRSDWTAEQITAAVNQLRWDVGAAVPDEWTEERRGEHVEGTPYPYDRSTAFALYQQIIAPVASALESKRHLFIAAGGTLASLPFSILVTEEPVGDDTDPQALRDTNWLADAYALTHIPSIQSLQFLRRASEQEDSTTFGASFAGFGDPVLMGAAQRRGERSAALPETASLFSRTQTRSGLRMASVSSLRALARLPGTARELQNIGQLLGVSEDAIYLAERATETAVRTGDFSSTRILSFATHGLTGVEIGSLVEPGLVLTPPAEASEEDDGYLGASEVTALRLNADWVILSACNTATGDDNGLSALARAFFYAGARNLLASHWPVDDDVASLITVRTFELLRDNSGLSRAQAFQQAMREIRIDDSHDSSTSSWAHPAYWAPFVLIGGS